MPFTDEQYKQAVEILPHVKDPKTREALATQIGITEASKRPQFGPPPPPAAPAEPPDPGVSSVNSALPSWAQLPKENEASLPPSMRLPPGYQPTDPDVTGVATNASGRKSLDVPPEYVPPGKHMILPAVFDEPSRDQFKQEMGPLYALKGIDLSDTNVDKEPAINDAYSQYADKKWKQRVAEAAADQTPVIRQKFTHHTIYAGLANVVDTAEAGVQGVANGIVPGLTEQLAMIPGDLGAHKLSAQLVSELREQQARHPLVTQATNLAGAVLPESAISQVAGRTAEAIGGAGKLARTLGAGVAGAAGGVANQALAEESNREADHAVDPGASFDSGASLKRMLIAGGIGGSLGTAGGALSEGANSARMGRSGDRGMQLAHLEGAHGATDIVHGVVAPPEMAAAYKLESGGMPWEGKPVPLSTAAQDVAEVPRGAIADQASLMYNLAKDRARVHAETYNSDPVTGAAEVAPNQLVASLLSTLRKRSIPESEDALIPSPKDSLPFARTSEFVKATRQALKARLDLSTRGALGEVPLSLDEAKAAGMDLEALRSDPSRTTGSQGASDHNLRIWVKPRPLTAGKFEQIVRGLDDAAKVATPASGSVDPAYTEAMVAARKDRANFPPHPIIAPQDEHVMMPDGRELSGYAAMQYRDHLALSDAEHTIAHAGLNPNSAKSYEAMAPNDQMALNSSLAQHGRPGSTKEGNLARVRLAADADARMQPGWLPGQPTVSEGLAAIPAMSAYGDLRGESSLASIGRASLGEGGIRGYASGFGTAMGLRADALLRNIAKGPTGKPPTNAMARMLEQPERLAVARGLPPPATPLAPEEATVVDGTPATLTGPLTGRTPEETTAPFGPPPPPLPPAAELPHGPPRAPQRMPSAREFGPEPGIRKNFLPGMVAVGQGALGNKAVEVYSGLTAPPKVVTVADKKKLEELKRIQRKRGKK